MSNITGNAGELNAGLKKYGLTFKDTITMTADDTSSLGKYLNAVSGEDRTLSRGELATLMQDFNDTGDKEHSLAVAAMKLLAKEADNDSQLKSFFLDNTSSFELTFDNWTSNALHDYMGIDVGNSVTVEGGVIQYLLRRSDANDANPLQLNKNETSKLFEDLGFNGNAKDTDAKNANELYGALKAGGTEQTFFLGGRAKTLFEERGLSVPDGKLTVKLSDLPEKVQTYFKNISKDDGKFLEITKVEADRIWQDADEVTGSDHENAKALLVKFGMNVGDIGTVSLGSRANTVFSTNRMVMEDGTETKISFDDLSAEAKKYLENLDAQNYFWDRDINTLNKWESKQLWKAADEGNKAAIDILEAFNLKSDKPENLHSQVFDKSGTVYLSQHGFTAPVKGGASQVDLSEVEGIEHLQDQLPLGNHKLTYTNVQNLMALTHDPDASGDVKAAARGFFKALDGGNQYFSEFLQGESTEITFTVDDRAKEKLEKHNIVCTGDTITFSDPDTVWLLISSGDNDLLSQAQIDALVKAGKLKEGTCV